MRIGNDNSPLRALQSDQRWSDVAAMRALRLEVHLALVTLVNS
jgi:hypothetical protein